MSQKYVGIDLGSHRVKVVVLSSSLRGVHVVETFEEFVGAPEPREKGEAPDLVVHRLSLALSMLRSRNLAGEQIAVSIPPELLSYRLLDFPFADERRIAQTVGFEADGQFAVPIEQLVIGHLVVPAQEGGRALVAAAKREKVEQISGVFRRAGYDVKGMMSPAVAAAQVAKFESDPTLVTDASLKSGAILLDIGHRFTHLTALSPKGPVAVRSLRRGGRNITQAIATQYRLDIAAAEHAKHHDAFVPHHGIGPMTPAQLEAARLVAEELEPLLRELEQTRLWLRGAQQLDITQILLTGGGAELRGLSEYLQEQTGIRVSPAVAQAPGLRSNPELGAATRSLAALGTGYGAARRPLLALVDEAPGSGQGNWLQERMPSLLAMGVAVMAFGALDTIAKIRAAEAELAAYEDQLKEVTRDMFGEALEPDAVEGKLALAEGPDLTSLMPQRSALDVLAIVTKVATPSDLEEAERKAAEDAVAASLPFAGRGTPEEEMSTDSDSELDSAFDTVSVDPNAGIVVADDLTISEVHIYDKKLEIHAMANASSTQDRFAAKLLQQDCINEVLKGKVKGNERRSFEMSISHSCYRKSSLSADESEN